MTKLENLVGRTFVSPEYGKIKVFKQGPPSKGTETRVTWDCQKEDGTIVNVVAKYLKRYDEIVDGKIKERPYWY